MNPKAHRLPETVRPQSYDVTISTAPDRTDFSGVVEMVLDVLEPADAVEMNARALNLSEAVITIGETNHNAEISTDDARQTVTFTPPEPLAKGQAKLRVNFAGKLSESMHGIYLAEDGSAKAVCTQCEATDARAIFPCFDEPDFKATLKWTIRAPKDLLALSNGIENKVEASGEDKVWYFDATRPISSYLAALVVGDFESSAVREVNGTPLRVYAPRGKAAHTEFALDYTARLLPWYEAYFDIKYPYGKYDQVAVPGFDAGAMENVGLVLFRQNYLLMDPESASWRSEKVIATVIAHEFAHMWFGNLVTMKWWDDLWLNEAFAEWMAHKACDALSPDYRVWDDFQGDKNRALADDALPTTHPIWTDVQTPDEALEMFDVITYQKGCAVMRMLENFLGEDAFKKGLRTYMQEFQNDNARGADLWRHLEAASDQPVGELMRSWVSVSGFPVLSVALTGSDAPAMYLAQKRFFSAAGSPEDTSNLWNVPVVVRFEDDEGIQEHRFIMKTQEHTESLPATGKVRWAYANASEIGFYRMQPSQQLKRAILDNGLERLTPIEQMGFLEDQWALLRNGSERIESFLDLLDAYAQGPALRDHNVLRAVIDRSSTLDQILEDSGDEAARAGFRQWLSDRFSSALADLGFERKEGEPQNDIQRRALLVHAVARLARAPEAIAEAERLADKERADAKSVDPNLAGTFIHIAAMVGDKTRYETWLDTYLTRRGEGLPPQLVLRYLYTLGVFRPAELVERTLGLIDDGTIPQDAVGSVTGQLLGQRHAQVIAWNYLKENWDALKSRVGDMGVSRVVEAVGALLPEHREDIVSFFEKNPPGGAERALARALERMDQAAELRSRVTDGLRKRFTP